MWRGQRHRRARNNHTRLHRESDGTAGGGLDLHLDLCAGRQRLAQFHGDGQVADLELGEAVAVGAEYSRRQSLAELLGQRI